MVRERTPRQLNFVNAYTLTVCRRNQQFADVLNGSALNLPDGMSVVWGVQWLGMHFPERVAGPDLTEGMCARAEQKGYRVFFMGSSPQNLADLKAALLKRYPKLNIVGMHSPSMSDQFSEEETQSIISEIAKTSPDILFVGVSTGKQETWISRNLERINVPACLAVGAAFDFLSGRVPRAPEWLRERGLEWLYRLYCEPRRLWKRYLLGNFVFLLMLTKASLRKKFGHETH
jgi:N-acetylglucosaminyldiphosphoundecaprenol N-acetyl-beta-D-mannosaminyltransferase